LIISTSRHDFGGRKVPEPPAFLFHRPSAQLDIHDLLQVFLPEGMEYHESSDGHREIGMMEPPGFVCHAEYIMGR
jgi:hypothetical protein